MAKHGLPDVDELEGFLAKKSLEEVQTLRSRETRVTAFKYYDERIREIVLKQYGGKERHHVPVMAGRRVFKAPAKGKPAVLVDYQR